ncbi:uncharacterized protein LOC111632999 [Centruroides sculpturatus]|uniref:uncharacterized protein LOC111632999 n=1 Tax=Centruroides sculpturatus TaxID=218467 RepID=UPI000C6D627F|nr:uncharacterized protein LOC111632999 [Centruroides sculpturatus]
MYKPLLLILFLSRTLSQPINKNNTLELILKNHRLTSNGGEFAQLLKSYGDPGRKNGNRKADNDQTNFSQSGEMNTRNGNVLNNEMQYVNMENGFYNKQKQAEDSEGRNQRFRSNWEDLRKEFINGGETDWKGFNGFESSDGGRSYTNGWNSNEEPNFKTAWNGINSGNIGKGWILPVNMGNWNGIGGNGGNSGSGGGGGGGYNKDWNVPVNGRIGFIPPNGCCIFSSSSLGNGWNTGQQSWNGLGYGNAYNNPGFGKGWNSYNNGGFGNGLKNKWLGFGNTLGSLLGSFSLFGKKKVPYGWNAYNC